MWSTTTAIRSPASATSYVPSRPGRRHPRRIQSCIGGSVERRALVDPAAEEGPFLVGHPRLVGERHVLGDDGPLPDQLGATANALRRVEGDAVRGGAEDVVGGGCGVARAAAELDDAPDDR